MKCLQVIFFLVGPFVFFAQAQVDLIMDAAKVIGSEVIQGGTIDIKLRLKNLEAPPVAGNSVARIYLSTDNAYGAEDIEVGNVEILNTSFGENGISSVFQTTLTIPVDAPTGSFFVVLLADADNAIVETNENNNELAKPLTVLAADTGGGGGSSNQWTGNDNTTDAIYREGAIGIGVSTFDDSGFSLYVRNGIKAEAVTIELPDSGWGDFVFERDYPLLTIPAMKAFIEAAGHLPAMPSEADLQQDNGFDMAEMTKLQQVKIEELHLYIIQLHERIEALEKALKIKNER